VNSSLNADINILQGSLATRLNCVAIFSYTFIVNLQLKVSVGECWKSESIWWQKKLQGSLFRTTFVCYFSCLLTSNFLTLFTATKPPALLVTSFCQATVEVKMTVFFS